MNSKLSTLSFLFSAFCFLTITFFVPICVFSQPEIPIGTWRMHLSYNKIKSVAVGNDFIYGAAESGILMLDRNDNSLSAYNKLNGLTGTDISYIAYDGRRNQLLVAYSDGNLDIVKDNQTINFNRLKNASEIIGSKTINHITIKENLAYMSADYGVLVFDLIHLELKETWRDLGPAGKTLKVFESTFKTDSIYLATEKGIIAGNLNNNLLDFNNWKRFDSGDFAKAVNAITNFNSKIYAAVDNQGIYTFENNSWVKKSFLQQVDFNFLTSSANYLYIADTNKLWKLSPDGILTAIENPQIISPLAGSVDEMQNLWIGDVQHGLLSSNFISYMPNGPSVATATRLKFNNGKLYALSGGYTTAGLPLGQPGVLNTFAAGVWDLTPTSLHDLTDIEFMNNETFISSFGDGLQRNDINGNIILYDNSNSPLKNTASGKSVFISAIEASTDGLWIAEYGASSPLYLFKNDQWQSFTFDFPAAQYPVNITLDLNQNVWMIPDPGRGGGILYFNKSTNGVKYFTEIAGNGALPNSAVHAAAVDREGFVWLGTDKGVAYFFSPQNDAVKPIFENHFLLSDEKITTIKVDGGNRKWIGTEHGVWLFSPSGEQLIYNFTAENSPLLSNVILDIEINNISGEVFFSTTKGIVSYRADATGPEPGQQLKIFPNPVTADFSGNVGISGLPTDAIVKITDVSGKLIWQTQANGSTATWNVRDYHGRRASTGIYLVFAAAADGSESIVGKIAVVN